MFFFKIILAIFIGMVLPSLISLGLGLLLAKTERFHRIGIRMISMSVLVPGCFISSRCRQKCICADVNCGNWTCDMYSHCGSWNK